MKKKLCSILESTPKDISWNDFQTLMKGEGNTAENAEAYFKFVGKDGKFRSIFS